MSKDSVSPGRILVGPAGWSYKDWEGQVYPTPKPRGFDALGYLAQYFDAIEINATFYRIPAAKTTQQWADRVRDHAGFRFTAKLWQGFTHEGTAGAQDAAAFRRAMDPLHEAGCLGAVLLQFPYRFHHTQANQAHLRHLAEAFQDYSLVLEVRHRSWDQPDVYAFLSELGMGFCNIDQPQVSYSIGLTDRVTSSVGYLRLHGRNAAAWFAEGRDSAERYNYRYAGEELQAFQEITEALSRRAQETYLITNNHFRGQAAFNALELRARAPRQSAGAPDVVERLPGAQLDRGAGARGRCLVCIVGNAASQWRRLRLHDLDRPAPLSRHEPQPHVHDAQEVTAEAAAGWAIGRHGLRDEEPRASRRELRQRLEHPLKQQGRLLACDGLVKEVGQRIEQDHKPDGVSRQQWGQALTKERGELPAGEGADEMDAAQEDLGRDAAGLRHRHQGSELEGHVRIDDGHLGAGCKDTGRGVEGYGMHPMIAPQEERARLWRQGQCRTHGQ
jgi:uncharacterized protein YecE (DUF72 family)